LDGAKLCRQESMMASTEPPATSTMRLGVAALPAGRVVFVLQFPWGGGVDTDPPTCFGMFGAWTVPCGGWPTVAGGIVTALIVWVVLLVRENPRLT
jgi:hypothetical protein